MHESRCIENHKKYLTHKELCSQLSNIFMYASLPNYIYHALSQAKPCYARSCRTMRFILEFIFIFIIYHRAILAFTFTLPSQAKPSQAKGSARTPTVCNFAASDAFPILSFPFHLLPLRCLDEEKYIFILDTKKKAFGSRANVVRISKLLKK